MKKILTSLGLSMLVLSSCGTGKKVEVSDKYNYHEIVECDIPVAKRFDRIPNGRQGHPYDRNYLHIINREAGEANLFFILKPDKRLKKRFSDYAHKKSYEEVASKYGNFKIYKSDFHNPVTKSLISVTYTLMGERINKKNFKTFISFNAPTEAQAKEELDYLLDYCQQTWRKSKKEGGE